MNNKNAYTGNDCHITKLSDGCMTYQEVLQYGDYLLFVIWTEQGCKATLNSLRSSVVMYHKTFEFGEDCLDDLLLEVSSWLKTYQIDWHCPQSVE